MTLGLRYQLSRIQLVEIGPNRLSTSPAGCNRCRQSFPHSSFDFAISIAVVHHLSTPTRRIGAIAAILESLRPCLKEPGNPTGVGVGGRVLIYVWALEQKHSRRGWDEGNEQDVMVPWVMKRKVDGGDESSQTFNRYYHLYRRGELEEDILQAGGIVDSSGYEKDNWWAVATRRPTQ